jgi:tetratricopeptide (TPR) repeat protein
VDHADLYERILRRVDEQAYLPLADSVDPAQKDAMASIQRMITAHGFDPEATRQHVLRLAREGRIDQVMKHSALHVIAASPAVRDYTEAARQVGEQELAAMRLGGPRLAIHLASVERHRGVLAFLLGQYELALDYFSRAFERQRSPGNLANVLTTLLRLGELEEATDLLHQIRGTLPRPLVMELDRMIQVDPDLATLRSEITP